MHSEYWWESQKEGRPRCRQVDNIKVDIRGIVWGGMNGLIWLRIGTNGRLL
jgi:hypothetical protein